VLRDSKVYQREEGLYEINLPNYNRYKVTESERIQEPLGYDTQCVCLINV
jgi:hypothetical protein